MWRTTETQRARVRQLPSGGFVAIDVTAGYATGRPRVYHGALVVEHGDEAHRDGYSPSVVASTNGASAESVVRQLLPLLQDYPSRVRAGTVNRKTKHDSESVAEVLAI